MKLVIITGASRGIGAAAAQMFIREGYEVVNLSRSACSVEGVRNLSVDLGDIDQLNQACAELSVSVVEAEQTVVVHNAAVLDKDNTETIEADRFSEVLSLNVVAPAAINAQLLASMSSGSSIIYVGSTLSTKAVANSLSYVTSKHALLGLMRATCQDLIGKDIHTAMVMPGFTDTEMLRDHVGQDQSILDALASNVVMGRLAKPSEIASVIYQAAINPVLNGAEIDANLGQIQS